ncbi:MAG TPA: ABC transporter substrate-binding protein [Firmicutes bacterium]|nr:ABC transporter substrate-binding protein [Bacillota bacterium]
MRTRRALLLSLVWIVALAGLGVCSIIGAQKPLELTMFSYDINPNYTGFEDPIGREITKRTGIKLSIEYPVGDPEERIMLMIASGEYPDLIFHKGAGKFVDAGAFIDLTSYIEQYGANIKKLYGPYLKRMRYDLNDRSIYYLGCYGVDSQIWDVSGFELQHAVVKELGYPKMETLQDFENAIKAYMKKYPTIDGRPTIGLSLLADDWRFLISVTNPAVAATGAPDDGQWYIDFETQEAVYHITRPEEKEYFRWLNHMNALGLLDPESFVQKYDQYKAKIAQGRVLALTDQRWEYEEAERALRQAGKFERTYGNYPIVLDERFKRPDLWDPGYSASWGVGISVNCKHKEEAFKFLDWMASDEAQVLVNWGLEGVNYRVENRKRVIPPAELEQKNNDPLYIKKSGVGLYVYPFPQRGDGLVDPTGNTYTTLTKDFIKERYSPVEKQVLASYGAEMWMDLYPQSSEFPLKPWGAAWQIPTPMNEDFTVPLQRCDDLCKKRIPEIVLADPSAFDRLWDNFQKELENLGIHKAEAIFTQLIQERIALWND